MNMQNLFSLITFVFFAHFVILNAQRQNQQFRNNQNNNNNQQRPFVRHQFLYQRPQSNLLLTINSPLGSVYQRLRSQSFPHLVAKRNALVRLLREVTWPFHAKVIAALRIFNLNVESLWVSNQVSVKNANPRVVGLLSGLSVIREIASDIVFPIMPSIKPSRGRQPNGTEWHVHKIGASNIWRQTRGQGVTIGVIDTGVRGSHVALRNNYAGLWHDPILKTSYPTDSQGHGTHVTAIAVGTTGTGIAPGARWMACRGCDSTNCPQSALLSCGQWMLCPGGDCSRSPNIISNSWGHSGGQTWYRDVINAWNAAGIISVFAVGNYGPNCGTAESPADNPGVISVGSSSPNDAVSTFSARGPKRIRDGDVVPHLLAIGENINSAYHYNDNAYQVMSGTSMSTPIVAGAAALILSRNRNFDLNGMGRLLVSSANKNVRRTGSSCGGRAENFFPNDVTGNGILNLGNAFNRIFNG